MEHHKSICILMGFDYDENLPGSLIDLYRISTFVKRSMKPDNMIFITDICGDRPAKKYNKFIKSDLSSDILTMIDQQKENIFSFEDHNDILWILRENLMGADFVFFYFTGHIVEDSMIIKENCNSIKISTILNIIIESTMKTSEIFMLIDGCFRGEFKLNYTFDRVSPWIFRRDVCDSQISQKILVILPHPNGLIPFSTDMGSVITKQIVELFEQKKSLYEIVKNVNLIAEMTHPCDIPVWFYVGGFRSLNVSLIDFLPLFFKK